MMVMNRVSLFGKLTPLANSSITSAAGFCKERGNPEVELAHWVHQILQLPDSDLHRIIRHFAFDRARLTRDLVASLERLPRGATEIDDLSTDIIEAVERGWVTASLMLNSTRVSTGHVLAGVLLTDELQHLFPALSREFRKIKATELIENYAAIVGTSPEGDYRAGIGVGDSAAPPLTQNQTALSRFSVDLTEKARKGEIDPILGRDDEIRQVVDILMRRRQNNPILTGEAGVGKTAVVEGFALRIVSGDVPPALREVSLRTLDIGLLQAGASMKGEFESRLRQVIDEVQSSPKPVILFIDEAHTLIGAGGAAGTGDAANLLKPALARGTLRTIAATTWAEYKKYFEKDPALTRRFQVIQVEEPSEDKAILMMRAISPMLEAHHKVQILDEALEAAVRLSHRYIPARQLPDKAVSLLDTAAARVAIGQHAVPARVEDCRRRIQALRMEQAIIEKESATGIVTTARAAANAQRMAEEEERLKILEVGWQEEKTLVDRILALRASLRQDAFDADARLAKQAELAELQARLVEWQGDDPLILPTVDEQAVAAVVGDWTGIPVGRMVKNEIETVLKLAHTLKQRVIGQEHGLAMIARRIQTSRAKLDNPSKPVGVFMLCGPSGVGKTETALALAEALYGGEQNVITINMSEFQEAHTVSTLKGAPPGYVGYGEGGVLTEAVRRRPYSVVLLDEVEKAHADVHELFFQVFDKGFMEDGEGRYIDFRNCLILLTSNVGSDLIMNMCADPDLAPDAEALAKALRQPLLKVFPAALLGRIVTIPYYPLDGGMIATIIRLQLDRIKARVERTHSVPFIYDNAVVDLVASRCSEVESGGRMIDAILTNTILPEISGALLQRMLEGRSIAQVRLGVVGGDFSYDFD
ncbi:MULTISPECIES: type VI secretion system ATPase TssH [unclassified Azospirillum]|uniref:type VI secretion system ATPase TssH n=1 Tax=unclassified Azospirillum TaxID=2630922 RepID=UPI000B657528|nr:MULTISPECIES: type VI secretion system ATPase TssH [unclassified Azospirillum]SNS92523.1 type VI secretion system protein VasG [Azospirillum sp. RU38E]SNT09430.1 type VI secretion system protein VasG [Azospirillum sp. RU37A]